MVKHALIHEVAYTSLRADRRNELHRSIGPAIEQLHADRVPEHYEVLAHHFARPRPRRGVAVPVWSPTLRVGSSPIPRASGNSRVPCRPAGPRATLLPCGPMGEHGAGEWTERRGEPGRSAAWLSG
jgi:hypothetical protein